MKTYKYELSHQSNLIDAMHSMHVHLLRLQRRYYPIFRKYASYVRISRHIVKLKRRTKPHWDHLPSQSIQDIARWLAFGYQRFFNNIKDRKAGKTKRKVGRPKIKPNHRYKSVTFTQAGYKIEGNRLTVHWSDSE